MNLLGGWQSGLLALLLALNVGQFAISEVRLRVRDRKIAALEERIGLMVEVVTKADLQAALNAQGAEVHRRIAGIEETIKAIPRGRDTILIREVARPGPPGPPGTSGAPGSTGPPGSPGQPPPPGTPLIPPAEQPQAREDATERIVAWFDAGTLVGCDTPNQPASTVELLRQPGGRLLSTAPCVYKLTDEIRLHPALVQGSRWSFAAYSGWSVQDAMVLGLRAEYRLGGSWNVEGSAECQRPGVGGAFPYVTCGGQDYRLLAIYRF